MICSPALTQAGSTTCFGGLPSTGKTTFIAKIEKRCGELGLSTHVMPELLCPSLEEKLPTDPILFDTFLFAHRLQMSIDAPLIAQGYDRVFLERCYIDHLAFLELIDILEWAPAGHTDWCRRIVKELAPPKPDYYVYLSIPPELAFQRTQERNEARDSKLTLAFFEALDQGYKAVLEQECNQPIILDWTDFDSDLDVDEFLFKLGSPLPLIRPITPGDYEEVANLLRESYSAITSQENQQAIMDYLEQDIEDLRAGYHERGGQYWVASRGDQLLGGIGLKIDSLDSELCGKLCNLVVDPKRRRQGIATQLLKQVEAACLEAGLSKLFLRTYGSFEAACALYERNGFQETKRRPWRGTTLIDYEKTLQH